MDLGRQGGQSLWSVGCKLILTSAALLFLTSASLLFLMSSALFLTSAALRVSSASQRLNSASFLAESRIFLARFSSAYRIWHSRSQLTCFICSNPSSTSLRLPQQVFSYRYLLSICCILESNQLLFLACCQSLWHFSCSPRISALSASSSVLLVLVELVSGCSSGMVSSFSFSLRSTSKSTPANFCSISKMVSWSCQFSISSFYIQSSLFLISPVAQVSLLARDLQLEHLGYCDSSLELILLTLTLSSILLVDSSCSLLAWRSSLLASWHSLSLRSIFCFKATFSLCKWSWFWAVSACSFRAQSWKQSSTSRQIFSWKSSMSLFQSSRYQTRSKQACFISDTELRMRRQLSLVAAVFGIFLLGCEWYSDYCCSKWLAQSTSSSSLPGLYCIWRHGLFQGSQARWPLSGY